MFNAIICRYNEIAIKGNNRLMFENRLIENIYDLLKNVEDVKVSRVRGRIWIQHPQLRPFDGKELEVIKAQLPRAFGIESFSPIIMCGLDIDEICRAVDGTCDQFIQAAMAKKPVPAFRIRATRSNKKFPLISKEIEIRLAKTVAIKYDDGKIRVDLMNADVSVGCEVRDEFAFIYYESFRGPGGLPVGSNSPVLALLSGGIDSPVACYMTMKRGCRVNYITFHSSPYTPQTTVDKVKRIADELNLFQRPGKLHLCNLAPIQKLIRDDCNPRNRTVLYRRMMFRIAEKVARKTGCMALVTGESVGQVASQTIVNLNTINAAVNMLVLRPLIGMDKSEGIALAEKIGTFELSKEQVPDSCTVFAPPSPSTALPVDRAEEDEQHLPGYEAVLDEIIAGIEVYPPKEIM
jgi:thiamine biosynthesis protein ThiI